MDQQAFRQLLATPARPATGDGADSNTASDQQRRFGALAKRKADAAGSSTSSLTSFAPRSVPKANKGRASDEGQKPRQVGPKKNSATGEAYVDRAKARREGEDEGLNEFADVERLREDWEDKIRNAKDDEEREKLREQMAYLGGDAKHSVLVKGLDFALLEQQRTKAAGLISDDANEGSSRPAGDEELEALYEETKARATSGSPSAEDGASRGKRSRDEVIKALKRQRLGKASSAEEDEESARKKEAAKLDELERQKKLGKFRPIGASSVQSGKAKEDEGEKPEYIWKDGKRMRKKKKKRPEEEEKGDARAAAKSVVAERSHEGEAHVPRKAHEKLDKAAKKDLDSQNKPPAPDKDQSQTKSSEPGRDASDGLQQHAKSESPKPEAQASAEPSEPPAQPVPALEEDDDEDIFADAGSWKGVDLEDSDDEVQEGSKGAAAAKEAAATSAHAKAEAERGAGGRRDWFKSGREVEEDRADSNAQQEARAMLARIGARAGASKDDDDEAGEHDESGAPERPTRLQGLSDSVLPSEVTRAMLEKEEERERRRAEKLKERIMEQREKKRRRKAGGEAAAEGKEGEE